MRQTNTSLIPEHLDPKTQIAVSLSKDAFPKEVFPLSETFTHVDFIVASSQTKGLVKDNGTGRTSSDIQGSYSTEEGFLAYLAASIHFNYFLNKSRSSKRSEGDRANEIGENFINFIIGNSECPGNITSNCQNGPLKPNYNYWFAKLDYCEI